MKLKSILKEKKNNATCTSFPFQGDSYRECFHTTAHAIHRFFYPEITFRVGWKVPDQDNVHTFESLGKSTARLSRFTQRKLLVGILLMPSFSIMETHGVTHKVNLLSNKAMLICPPQSQFSTGICFYHIGMSYFTTNKGCRKFYSQSKLIALGVSLPVSSWHFSAMILLESTIEHLKAPFMV